MSDENDIVDEDDSIEYQGNDKSEEIPDIPVSFKFEVNTNVIRLKLNFHSFDIFY